MQQIPLSTLFNNKPSPYGLRGDPFLWEDMKSKIDSLKRPNTIKDFEKALAECKLTHPHCEWRNDRFEGL